MFYILKKWIAGKKRRKRGELNHYVLMEMEEHTEPQWMDANVVVCVEAQP